jgi:hypothetical protein
MLKYGKCYPMEKVMENYKICSCCVSDTTILDIEFDENSVFNFCKMHDRFIEMYPLNDNQSKKLNEIISKMKKGGEVKNTILFLD